MLTRPLIVSADHLDCEATDTGEGYQSEADCCFYEGARGGDESLKPNDLLKITDMDTFHKG